MFSSSLYASQPLTLQQQHSSTSTSTSASNSSSTLKNGHQSANANANANHHPSSNAGNPDFLDPQSFTFNYQSSSSSNLLGSASSNHIGSSGTTTGSGSASSMQQNPFFLQQRSSVSGVDLTHDLLQNQQQQQQQQYQHHRSSMDLSHLQQQRSLAGSPAAPLYYQSNQLNSSVGTWDSVFMPSAFSVTNSNANANGAGIVRSASSASSSLHINTQYLPSTASTTHSSNSAQLHSLSCDYNNNHTLTNSSSSYMHQPQQSQQQHHQELHYEQPPSSTSFYNEIGGGGNGPNSSMDTSSSTLSFGYTPALSFPRPSTASSIMSLENHFASTSFFGGMLDRPTTPPDSSVSFEGTMETSAGGGANGGGMNSSDRPEAMRTLYFGNLPPDLPISSFLNYVRGGVLEEVKYLQGKNCVFVTFLEAGVAASVYLEYQQNPFSIDGYEVRVGWGKPSTLHPSIRNQVMKGATRNVFVGNLDPEATVEELQAEFSMYGVVDCVRVIPDKRIGFVHMCSVGAAIKAVAHLCERDLKWIKRRVYYGKDRCATQAMPPPSTSPALPEENRTVYIGGIHADVTTKDLCDVIRGGLLQQIKYFPEKNICFATFISADAATTFYERSSNDGLVLKSKRMKIGWGKPSMLPLSIAHAVEKGASRNVYIGSIDVDASTKESIYAAFEEFGEIELVNIVAEKKIGFVSFTDIMSAIKAVEAMRSNDNPRAVRSGEAGLFRRVNFGKDRCANNFRITKASVSPPSSPDMISAVTPTVPYRERVYSICIDLGTTYSGYAISNKGSQITYSSSSGDDSAFKKEETCLVYKRVGGGHFQVISMGGKAFEARHRISAAQNDFIFIEDLKVRVSRYTSSAAEAAAASESRANPQKEPALIQILADYLSYLKTLAFTDCVIRFGSVFDPSLVQWVVSIPNIWTHHHKHLIRMACFEAGITDLPSCDTLVLCGEGDAAIMGLKWTGELMEMPIGSLVTVVDCGASETVISTFKVLPSNSYMPISKPTILGTGSDSIDSELWSRFASHVGEDVLSAWLRDVPGLSGRIEAQFRVLKTYFGAQRRKSQETSKKIRILNQDVMLFTISEAQEIITEVVEEIVQALDTHLKSIPSKSNSKVIAVGGFARSLNLTKRMSAIVGEGLVLPREPSKSILDGLTHLATKPNAIKERASRFSYGTQFSKVFDPKTDDPTAYRWGSPPHQFIAAFLPFTKAGTPIPPEKVFEQIVCPANDHQTEFPFGLYFSMEGAPKLADCTELVTLTVAIPDAYRHLGRENRFRILMVFGITEIKFSVVHTQSGETHESVVVL